MKCEHCNEPIDGKASVEDDKLYHNFCLEEYKYECKEFLYPYIDEDYIGMEELVPYLADTQDPTKWVIIRSNSEHGIYGVVSVDSEAAAINIVRDPNYDMIGYDRFDAVYHNGRKMNVNVTLT